MFRGSTVRHALAVILALSPVLASAAAPSGGHSGVDRGSVPVPPPPPPPPPPQPPPPVDPPPSEDVAVAFSRHTFKISPDAGETLRKTMQQVAAANADLYARHSASEGAYVKSLVDFDTNVLSSSSITVSNVAGDFKRTPPPYHIVETVVGYGDTSRSTARDLALASGRAKAVADMLTSLAYPGDRVTVTVGSAGSGPPKPGQVTVHTEWVM